MKRCVHTHYLLPALACVFFLTQTAGALESLADDVLADIGAQAGIQINLEFRINANADGSLDPCPAVAGAADCRLALSGLDRRGFWVVMKEYRGITRLTDTRIDAANAVSTTTDWSSGKSVGMSPNTYLGTHNPNNKPVIQLTTAPWGMAYAAGSTSGTFYSYMNKDAYDDLAMLMNIGRMTAEYDCGTAINTAAGIHVAGCSSSVAGWDGVDRVPGYLRDAIPGAPISLRTAHGISASTLSPNAPAQMRLDGRLQLYGF